MRNSNRLIHSNQAKVVEAVFSDLVNGKTCLAGVHFCQETMQFLSIMPKMKRTKKTISILRKAMKGFSGFWHASASGTLYRHLKKDIRKKEDLFLILCFGDLLGLPVPTYITLKLLPHLIAELPDWRRRFSRRRSKLWEAFEEFNKEF